MKICCLFGKCLCNRLMEQFTKHCRRPMNTLNDLFHPHTPPYLTTDQPAEQEGRNQSIPHSADEAEHSTTRFLRLPGTGQTRQQGQNYTKHSTYQHIHWDIVLLGTVLEIYCTCDFIRNTRAP